MDRQNISLLGIDLGSSSVKVSLLNGQGEELADASYPENEMNISSPQPGWAEQDPEEWFGNLRRALGKLTQNYGSLSGIRSIGISYQMHGLVVIDEKGKPLRPAIIWCDGRAVEQGKKTTEQLGKKYCLENLLNLPGNFTSSKLRWVQENEPQVYSRISKFMLPGDYLAYRLTGVAATTISGLSEGTFFDVQEEKVSDKLIEALNIASGLIPGIVPTFGHQGNVSGEMAEYLGIPAGIPVAYRAGDQPNNALSLKAMEDGEFAATAGTSGVIYGVTAKPLTDSKSRVNTFVHVNHRPEDPRYGVLLCINGAGIMNHWLKTLLGREMTYGEMNHLATQAAPGSDGLMLFPFGNGPERIFENRTPGASLQNLDLNRHQASHLCRAVQEGIVFAMVYGLEMLQDLGMKAGVIRAGHANMFLSETFRDIFVQTSGVPVELYNTNGAIGAAIGGGIGAGLMAQEKAFEGLTLKNKIEPDPAKRETYSRIYATWKKLLNTQLTNI